MSRPAAVGDTVWYFRAPEPSGGDCRLVEVFIEPLAALVLRVLPDGLLNLRVFPDSHETWYCQAVLPKRTAKIIADAKSDHIGEHWAWPEHSGAATVSPTAQRLLQDAEVAKGTKGAKEVGGVQWWPGAERLIPMNREQIAALLPDTRVLFQDEVSGFTPTCDGGVL